MKKVESNEQGISQKRTDPRFSRNPNGQASTAKKWEKQRENHRLWQSQGTEDNSTPNISEFNAL